MTRKARIAVLISGNGSNLQAIIDSFTSSEPGSLNVNIVEVISNKPDAYGLTRAKKTSPPIPTTLAQWKRKEITREVYDIKLAKYLATLDLDLIVCAGWMHIFSKIFFTILKTKSSHTFPEIINLHPGLPGQFPGKDAIGDAFKDFQKNKFPEGGYKTGVMVHYVSPELDAGIPIETQKVNILPDDTEETLRTRVQLAEKPVLLKAIISVLKDRGYDGSNQLENVRKSVKEESHKMSEPTTSTPQEEMTEPKTTITRQPKQPKQTYPELYTGKVRKVLDLGNNVLAMIHSDRLSSFDRHITDIPGKGSMLTGMSKFWFMNTKEIVKNHYISATQNVMFVRKCKPLMVEVVVRAFITGSTNTSLWTHYNAGERTYCGIEFPDGLVKNQRLAGGPIITPTTKSDTHDLPISAKQVVEMGLATQEQWDFIAEKAMAVFKFGQNVMAKNGYYLVDTKYEFGIDEETGEILLIDEVNTCDSSRFWVKQSYAQRFNAGLDPERLDKDQIREWLKNPKNKALPKDFDPYNADHAIPQIPDNIKAEVQHSYLKIYQLFSSDKTVPVRGELLPIVYPSETEIISKFIAENTNTHTITPTIEEIVEAPEVPEVPEVPNVVIIMGSASDTAHCVKISTALREQGLFTVSHVASAHKNAVEVLRIIDNHKNDRIVYVTVAGRSNGLSGVTAGHSTKPVFACPPFQDKVDMLTNINSTLQMPSNVPVMTVLDPGNLALAIKRIFDL